MLYEKLVEPKQQDMEKVPDGRPSIVFFYLSTLLKKSANTGKIDKQ